jgi:hypothetical protein
MVCKDSVLAGVLGSLGFALYLALASRSLHAPARSFYGPRLLDGYSFPLFQNLSQKHAGTERPQNCLALTPAVVSPMRKCGLDDQYALSTAKEMAESRTLKLALHGEIFAAIRSTRFKVVPWRMAHAP